MAEIKIKTPDGNNHVSLTTANASGDATVTLPKADIDLTGGSDGQYLKTNGSGTLSWGTVSTAEQDASTGNYTLTSGNLVIATAGKGIDFSATTDESGSAASMDSELFADYEEGEWTPDLTFSTSSTGISYNYRGGRYIKVGNLVHCSAYIFLSSKGSGSGYAEVSLPIQPMNAAPSVTHAQGGFCTESGGWADNKTMVILRVRGDASKAYVQCNTSSTNHHAYAEIADFTDSTKMIMTFIYRST